MTLNHYIQLYIYDKIYVCIIYTYIYIYYNLNKFVIINLYFWFEVMWPDYSLAK